MIINAYCLTAARGDLWERPRNTWFSNIRDWMVINYTTAARKSQVCNEWRFMVSKVPDGYGTRDWLIDWVIDWLIVIKNFSSHKHRDVFISSDLRWNNDITFVNELLKIGNAKKFTLDRKSLETVYLSFIWPSLEYASTLWAGAYENDLSNWIALRLKQCALLLVWLQGPPLQIYTGTLAGYLSMTNSRSTASFLHKLPQLFKGSCTLSGWWTRTLMMQPPPLPASIFSNDHFFPCTISLWDQLDLEIWRLLSVIKEAITPKHEKFEHFYHSCDRWWGFIRLEFV